MKKIAIVLAFIVGLIITLYLSAVPNGSDHWSDGQGWTRHDDSFGVPMAYITEKGYMLEIDQETTFLLSSQDFSPLAFLGDWMFFSAFVFAMIGFWEALLTKKEKEK